MAKGFWIEKSFSTTLSRIFPSYILFSFPRLPLVFSVHSLRLRLCSGQFIGYKNWPRSSYPVVFIVRRAFGLLWPSELRECLTRFNTHTLSGIVY